MYQLDLDKGIVNEGNQFRIRRAMRKAHMSGKLTVGFIGGSITQGSLASQHHECYAARVLEWWERKFPGCDIKYVNAGIGGTTSHFGAARVQSDLLDAMPDFVIVEFSVNDEDNDFFMETYEGLVRKILSAPSAPGVMLVHNVRYDNGISAEEHHGRVGKYYNLPCVSMRTTIYPKVMDGTIPVRDITEDDLHPNDLGHEMVSEVIINMLEKIYRQMIGVENGVETALPLPMTANKYEESVRYRNINIKPLCRGFVPDMRIQNGITDTFKKGWTAKNKGDKIRFEITGSEIAIQYRKSVNKPTPKAIAVVDGNEEDRYVLDGNFEENWGDCTYLQPVLVHGERKEHIVEIEIIEEHEDDKVPFYLVSVLGN